MELGRRIIFDQDGDIVFQTPEMSGDVLPHKEITHLHIIDLDYGQIPSTHEIVNIDVETMKPILKETTRPKTPGERVQELENELLLLADNETGGIL